MANTTGLGLDQSQIADAINRQNVGLSQKKRNEMMRTGSQSPDAFAMQNQPAIQQAQQPSEFWGAGRKELDPNSDTSLLAALGGSKATLGGQDYYYSPYDLSKTSWGTMQAGDTDLGQGKYDIMRGGQSLGTGYKSLADTLKDYGLQNQVTGNTAKDWETLGQMLNYGKLTGNYGTPHSGGGNQVADPITGLNTLFGSKPIIYDGKLIGYNQVANPTPVNDQWNDQRQWNTGGGFLQTKTTHNSYDVGYNVMGRKYENPNWWKQNIGLNSDNTYTINPEAAATTPGWTNADAFARQAGESSYKSGGAWYKPGAIGNALFGPTFHEDVGKVIDPILNYFIPTFGGTVRVGRATDTIGNGGTFADSMGSASRDGWEGAAKSLVTQILADQLGGVAGGAGEAMGATGSTASAIDTGLSTAAKAGATTAVNGGGWNDIGKAALSSGFGSLAGGLTGAATKDIGPILSKMAAGAASGGVNSLFNSNSPIAGAGYGAMSGGLWGYLNSVSQSNDSFNKETNKQNKTTAEATSKLARTLFSRKK